MAVRASARHHEGALLNQPHAATLLPADWNAIGSSVVHGKLIWSQADCMASASNGPGNRRVCRDAMS